MKRTFSSLQRGFSLVELMVAMTVGLIISAGAAALFANTILSTRTLSSATQVQEAGTQIVATLSRQLRMAGYMDWLGNNSAFDIIGRPDDSEANAKSYNLEQAQSQSVFQMALAKLSNSPAADAPNSLSGCDGAYQNPSTLHDTACGATSTVASALSVAYHLASVPDDQSAPKLPALSDVFSSLKGGLGDCNNNQPDLWRGASANLPFAVNRYYLSPAAINTAQAGEPTLYDFMCQGNSGTAQPFASNIEQFVVLYGLPGSAVLQRGSNDLQVQSYATAAQIAASNNWSQVIAVRFCVLVAGDRNSAAGSPDPNNPNLVTDRNDCLGSPIRLGPGKRLRQAFISTVTLRNHVRSTAQSIN